MGLGQAISRTSAKAIDYAKKKPVAAALIVAFQVSAAVDQFQYEAAYNMPENFEIGDVVDDVLWGNVLDFGPLSEHWSRTFDGADPHCANQGQIFNNSIEWAKKNDPTEGVAEFSEFFVRWAHIGSLPGAEIGSFAYESYDTVMKLLYDKSERQPGACIL